jgi:hypothetical protein
VLHKLDRGGEGMRGEEKFNLLFLLKYFVKRERKKKIIPSILQINPMIVGSIVIGGGGNP